VLGHLLLQAHTRHLIPVNTSCSQPLCADRRSSVTRGIDTVTGIPDQPYDIYSSMIRRESRFRSWLLLYSVILQ